MGLITTYLVVLLRHVFAGGLGYDTGTRLEVSRQDRCNMLAAGVARDASDEEIAVYRAETGQGGTETDDEVAAALDAAKTELATVGAARDALQTQVETLTQANGELSKAVEELRATNATQAKALEAATKKAAKAS